MCGYSFSSLQTLLDEDQTLAAKTSFETHSSTFVIKINPTKQIMEDFQKRAF